MPALPRLATYSHRLPASKWKVRAGRILAAGMGYLGAEVISPITLNDGSMLILDSRGRTEGEPYWSGTFDEDMKRFLIRCIDTFGNHVVDIGANVGLISIPLARAGAVVYAIEPVPQNAVRIIESASLNGVTDQIHLTRVALGESPGTLTLVSETGLGAATGNAVDSSISPDRNGSAVEVPVVRFDDLGLGSIDLVKIDVEGAEAKVLRGAEKAIGEYRPIIFGEFHNGLMPRYGHSFLDVADVLSPMGYRYFTFLTDRSIAEQTPRPELGNVLAVPTEQVDRLPITIVGPDVRTD